MVHIFVRLAVPMLGAMAASLLQGCADRGVQVPDVVQEMIDADFPADGQVHAQARGRFRIEPATVFCTFRGGYSLNNEELDAALRRIGQRPMHGGSLRTTGQANISRDCIPGRSVFVRAFPSANRQRRPYRMILAIWQGDAACVGAIERADGRRPGVESVVADIDLFNRAGNRQLQDRSISADMADLSRACLAHLSGAR